MSISLSANGPSWYDRVKKLRDDGAIWLPEDLETPIETRIVTKLCKLIGDGIVLLPPLWRYKPWLVESLLADVARTVDRAATYPREVSDVEIGAVKDALDLRDFNAFVGIDSAVVAASDQSKYAADQQDAFSKAAAVFPANKDAVAKDPLAAALITLFSGWSKAKVTLGASEGKKTKQLAERLKASRDSIDHLAQSHSELGNSYNFSDRAKRVERLLMEDLAEAVEKAHCAWAGMKVAFPTAVKGGAAPRATGIQSVSPPDPNKADTWIWPSTAETCSSYLDALLSWTRHAMRAIEHRTQFETEYEVLVPLAQEWRGVKPLFDSAGLQGALKKPQSLEVDIAASRFPPGSGRRLIGLAAHWIGTAAITPAYRIGISIQPPEQPFDTGNIPLPPVYFGHARDILTTDELNWTSLGALSNINPVGKWHVSIDETLLGLAGRWPAADGIADIVFVMRVRHEPAVA